MDTLLDTLLESTRGLSAEPGRNHQARELGAEPPSRSQNPRARGCTRSRSPNPRVRRRTRSRSRIKNLGKGSRPQSRSPSPEARPRETSQHDCENGGCEDDFFCSRGLEQGEVAIYFDSRCECYELQQIEDFWCRWKAPCTCDPNGAQDINCSNHKTCIYCTDELI